MCGISPCPLLADIRGRLPVVQSGSVSELIGPSPPSLFVGRYGYPDVRAGPRAAWVPDDSAAVPLARGAVLESSGTQAALGPALTSG